MLAGVEINGVMWLRVQKGLGKRQSDFECDDDAPRQVVLSTPDGNFTVYEKCEPSVKRWCPLSRIHSDHFKGDLIVPVESETATADASAGDEQVYDFDFYRKADDKEYDFSEDVELFRITSHLLDDDYISSQDSQDSNAEHYYTNDYPEDYWSD